MLKIYDTLAASGKLVEVRTCRKALYAGMMHKLMLCKLTYSVEDIIKPHSVDKISCMSRVCWEYTKQLYCVYIIYSQIFIACFGWLACKNLKGHWTIF